MTEPNCDMPWEIYLDWLQDQGNEDLRELDYATLVLGAFCYPSMDLPIGNGADYSAEYLELREDGIHYLDGELIGFNFETAYTDERYYFSTLGDGEGDMWGRYVGDGLSSDYFGRNSGYGEDF